MNTVSPSLSSSSSSSSSSSTTATTTTSATTTSSTTTIATTIKSANVAAVPTASDQTQPFPHKKKARANYHGRVENYSPLDAIAMEAIVRQSYPGGHFEPSILQQLLEFSHRYIREIARDSTDYRWHADRKSNVIEAGDVAIAVSSADAHHYAQAQPPSVREMCDLAHDHNTVNKNKLLLDYPERGGVKIPPGPYCVTNQNFVVVASHTPDSQNSF